MTTFNPALRRLAIFWRFRSFHLRLQLRRDRTKLENFLRWVSENFGGKRNTPKELTMRIKLNQIWKLVALLLAGPSAVQS